MKHTISICFDAVEWLQYEMSECGLPKSDELLMLLESVDEIEESTEIYLKSVRSIVIDGKHINIDELDIDPDFSEPDISSGLWRVHCFKKVVVDYEIELPNDHEFSAYCLKITEDPYTIQYQMSDDGNDTVFVDGVFVSDEGDFDNHVYLNGQEIEI